MIKLTRDDYIDRRKDFIYRIDIHYDGPYSIYKQIYVVEGYQKEVFKEVGDSGISVIVCDSLKGIIYNPGQIGTVEYVIAPKKIRDNYKLDRLLSFKEYIKEVG